MVFPKVDTALNTDAGLPASQRLTREQFLREAEAAWTAFQQDGLHVTGEEVQAWLRTWGTDNEQPAPACHK